LVLLAAVLAVLAGCLTGVMSLFERTLHVCPSSGNSLLVRLYDKNTVNEMRSAVEQAMTYQANAAGGVPSVADELGRLATLRSQGILSDSDWERAKSLFLGKKASAQEQAIEHLRQLHELRRNGVLSESEFNMKKWDVLSRAAS
jgi:hypothetical protein